MEHPLLSNTLRRLIALKAHTEEATFINCSIHRIISSHSCQLTAFKTGCMQSYQEEAVAVKEWYQNQDVPDADNVTQCFWAIPYKFSTWWSIKYNSKHLEKNAHLKTLLLFLVSEGEKKKFNFFLSSWIQLLQILCDTGGKVTLSWHLSKVSLMNTAKASLLCPLWPLIFRTCVYIWVSEGSTFYSLLLQRFVILPYHKGH